MFKSKIFNATLLFFLCFAGIQSFGQTNQFNDTIVYKSGMIRVVDITEFDKQKIIYNYVNRNQDTVNSFITMGVVDWFKIYDIENILAYESEILMKQKITRIDMSGEVTVSNHMLSVNPFLLPFLSANVRHTYNFGDNMQFGITSRFSYFSPIILDFVDSNNGDLRLGSGFKLTPFYNKKFSFGVDFSAMYTVNTYDFSDFHVLIPISFNLDFYSNQIPAGMAFDVGYGARYDGNGADGAFFRGHFGLFWRFQGSKTFSTNYR